MTFWTKRNPDLQEHYTQLQALTSCPDTLSTALHEVWRELAQAGFFFNKAGWLEKEYKHLDILLFCKAQRNLLFMVQELMAHIPSVVRHSKVWALVPISSMSMDSLKKLLPKNLKSLGMSPLLFVLVMGLLGYGFTRGSQGIEIIATPLHHVFEANWPDVLDKTSLSVTDVLVPLSDLFWNGIVLEPSGFRKREIDDVCPSKCMSFRLDQVQDLVQQLQKHIHSCHCCYSFNPVSRLLQRLCKRPDPYIIDFFYIENMGYIYLCLLLLGAPCCIRLGSGDYTFGFELNR